MKTIVLNENNLSLYVFNDNDVVILNSNNTNTENFLICDVNIFNSKLIENIVIPDDYVGSKYFFDGEVWTLNPEFNF
jgi:hypothetical protein